MYPEFQGPLQVVCRLTGVSSQKYLLPGKGTVHLRACPPPLPHPTPTPTPTPPLPGPRQHQAERILRHSL